MMKGIVVAKDIIWVRGYEFKNTSHAFPEQYDVFRDGEQVGYVRLRGGFLSCREKDCAGEIIYAWNFKDYDKSSFDNVVERIDFMKDIARVLECRNIN